MKTKGWTAGLSLCLLVACGDSRETEVNDGGVGGSFSGGGGSDASAGAGGQFAGQTGFDGGVIDTAGTLVDTGVDARVLEDSGGLSVDGSVDAPPAGPLAEWVNGTRLRAKIIGGAGVALFQTTFDKDLQTPCSFTRADDGAIRCMPPAQVPYFADASCTNFVLPVYGACAAAPYVSRIDSCKSTGFKTGALVALTKAYFKVGDTCKEVSIGETQTFYALTPVATSAFVAGTQHRDPRGGGLAMNYWKSDDGGFFPIGAWNVARAAACVEGTATFAGRCVPEVTATVSTSIKAHTNNTCTQSLAYKEVAACEPPPVTAIAVRAAGTCGLEINSFAEPIAFGGAPFRSSGNACFPWPTGGEARYQFFTAGAEFGPSTLPVLSSFLQGAGRLKVRRFKTATGTTIDATRAFVDSIGNKDCLVQKTSTGLRCMPSNSMGITFYSDASCTLPVIIEAKVNPNPQCSASRPTVIYKEKQAINCGGLPTIDLYAVGAIVTPPVLYLVHNDVCQDSGFDPAKHDVYSASSATDETTPALQEVVQ